jgi:hypothetical protein
VRTATTKRGTSEPLQAGIEAVLCLALHGWRLFPIRPHEKEPIIGHWPRKAASNPEIIRAWAEQYPGCNWGVACGPCSGIWVLDVDGEAGTAALQVLCDEHRGDLPETLTSVTARGRHLYYQYPLDRVIRNSAGKLAAGLDVRGDGGYVLVPPSVHPSGVYYKWSNSPEKLPCAPEWLLNAVIGNSERVQPTQRVGVGLLRQGSRNDGMTRLAGALRRRGKNYDEIEAQLLTDNARRCDPPLHETEIRKIAASIARYPVGGPDPLQIAWQSIDRDSRLSRYDLFIRLAQNLQNARPGLPIALPLERIAILLNCHYTQVGQYRKRAVVARFLIPEGNYVPNRRAGTYYVSLASLTSGLVRQPLITSPSETSAQSSQISLVRVPVSAASCYVHGSHSEWWFRSGEDAVCNRCHPNPFALRQTAAP